MKRYGDIFSWVKVISIYRHRYNEPPWPWAVAWKHLEPTSAEQELPEHLSSPRVLVGFVLLHLFSLMCMFCRSLFVLLYFFFWPLCCLFFFDIQIVITPLISSNFSQVLWSKIIDLLKSVIQALNLYVKQHQMAAA